MFVHLGGETVIPVKEIIAIVDLAAHARSQDTQAFLRNAEMEGRILDLSDGSASSFVVTPRTVYLSPISALTLMRRARYLQESDILGAESDSGEAALHAQGGPATDPAEPDAADEDATPTRQRRGGR